MRTLSLLILSLILFNIEELYQLGAASIHPNNKFDNFKEVKVKMKKLDDIKIDKKIGFIKIDVEGHELEVIEGAKNTIINNMPVLLIEIEKRHTKEPVENSINHIKKIGYECFFLMNKELILVDKLQDKKLENNYYFLPKKFKKDL